MVRSTNPSLDTSVLLFRLFMGESQKQIANELKVSPRTIASRLRRLKVKYKATTTAQLVAKWAMELELRSQK
jgi:DNA-binding CsgD family transcriptional regulator